jgi:phage gp29-like protein
MNGQNRILGPDGRPVSAERVRMEKQTRFNPLRGWTPDVLVRQLEAYSRGEIAALAWVMEWLEKHDDVISTVAPKAKAAVSRWGYDVLPKNEIRPDQRGMAEDQQGFLQAFYQNLETGDAVELEERGGMRLLVQQVMDAYGKGYGAHHIIWRPGRGTLAAELVKVPAWFFEATEGRLKYLPASHAQRGVELETLGGRQAWMISKGRGVMLAGVLARMFKQIPLQDWLTYCDRHGMPAFIGKTAAAKGTQGWTDMTDAVGSIGSEFGAVVNQGDMIEVLSLTGQGEIPYVKLVDRMDRAQVMLWRGGDLSTISRENGTGSNPQQEDSDELDADNAAWVSETLNRNLTARALRWKFGPGAPALCELRLRTKTRDNLSAEIGIVEKSAAMGVRVSKSWFLGKFGVVEADADEDALSGPAPAATAPVPPPAATAPSALNSATSFRAWMAAVRSGPAAGAVERLADAAGDAEVGEEEFLRLAAATLDAIRDLDPVAAAEMEQAMAAAAVQQLTR